ncbi:aryl-alcohol dehydrogenase [Artomyces pyxidatus]|uniref:Aryl-alcohol dehydrogenase n=1 Tax=Artomyces pyxidatus TaxID=48021 RepID=A0ACB8SU44_9AGAM|nr:aryl-alcohol dehydrogenase [Artomyces pyxidatus]
MTSLQVARRVPYVRLGNSGLKISRIILGCMSYGSPDWQAWVLGEKEGIEQIKYAYEAGIQTFDTANVYSNGASEVILGKAIKELQLPRDEIVVMTKLYGIVGREHGDRYYDVTVAESKGYVNQRGLSRKHIFESVKHSLERLQLDYIDLLQCHRFDYDTPVEETMQALHDVVKAGYVRYIGMSSCWAWQFHQMQNHAIANNLTPFISMQNQYSLVYREEEREMMPTLKHFGVGSIPWSPLARGAVTRPLGERSFRADNDIWHDTYLKEPSNQAVVNRVEEIAKKYNVSMAQVSLAWVMAKDVVAAPIVGTTSLEKLKDLIGALELKLTEEDIKYLEEPYKPIPVFGHS